MTTQPTSDSASAVPQLALLVDPDDEVRTRYRQFLMPQRFVIEEAVDGREALAKAISDPPDIVVMETSLFGLDGYALCDLLRRDRDTRHVPIVMVTGDVDAASIDRARRTADVVLTKPCAPPVLLASMRELMRKSEELRSHSAALRERAHDQLMRSQHAIGRAERTRARLSKDFDRYMTTNPPTMPPDLICPVCHLQGLRYVRTFIGGVSERQPEQWDELTCPSSCGTFQYRHRTRKLTRKP